jgi:hypothetical protein
MLKTVKQVSAGVIRDIGGNRTYSLETITSAVEAYSPIDQIIYVGFQSDHTNPIWGQFRKYGHQPSVYSGMRTVVEILYARHLNVAWRRFVVCKELCHSLETDEGTHSVSNRSVERIISGFSMMQELQSFRCRDFSRDRSN